MQYDRSLIIATYFLFSECIWNMTLNASESFTRRFLIPNWPYEYRGLRSCGWYISAPENRIIVLELVLSSGSNKKRSIDTLRVYSVEGSELRLLRRFRFAAFRSSFQYIPPVSRLIYILHEIEDEPRLFTRLHYVSYTATQAGTAPKWVGNGLVPHFWWECY